MDPATEPLLRTPLRDAHVAAGGRLVPFAGWEMPLDYGSILEESRAVRRSAGLFDVSHMGRARVRGPRVAEELDHALGAAMADVPVGTARYSLLLDAGGHILDDLIAYRTGPAEFLLVVNAANRERDLAALRERLDTSTLEDLTLDGGGILALQGPDSRHHLAALAGGASGFCRNFLDLATLEIPDLGPILVARTGYTGEHGYELFPDARQILPVWERLLAAGVTPAGLGARDVLRLEAGLPLYGHEIHEGVHPFEAGLRFGVRGWRHRDFVGAEALRANPDPPRELVGLVAEKRVPRPGYPVLSGDRQVGTVCSGAWSANLDHPIATALVEKGTDGPLAVDFRGRRLPVRRVALPFIPHRSREPVA